MSFPPKEDEESLKRELGEMSEENRGSVPSGLSQSLTIPISEDSERKISNKIQLGWRSWYVLNSGVGLLVVSLGVTVMQGRVIAILITSTVGLLYCLIAMHMEDGDRGMKKKQR